MGRKGGSSKSERKAQTARENGRRGGRPKKQKPEDDPGLPTDVYTNELPRHKNGGTHMRHFID